MDLPPIRENPHDYDAIEREIIEVFKREIYMPLLRQLQFSKTVRNSAEDLNLAIQRGRIRFRRGAFTGSFDASLSRALRDMGAVWDRSQRAWRISLSDLPVETRNAISLSVTSFERMATKIGEMLSKLVPQAIADKVQLNNLFEKSLWNVDTKINKSLKAIAVVPKLSAASRAKIADEYTNNLRLFIRDFTEKEIIKLRKKLIQHISAGGRHDELVTTIKKSYGVSQNKARFLARQETGLLMAKFKEDRYTSAGVTRYRWGCVAGSPAHPVRPMHKALEGKEFEWSRPPITDPKGNRNNPGQDYNCRCFARPMVTF